MNKAATMLCAVEEGVKGTHYFSHSFSSVFLILVPLEPSSRGALL
jgi:hypothetical protein